MRRRRIDAAGAAAQNLGSAQRLAATRVRVTQC